MRVNLIPPEDRAKQGLVPLEPILGVVGAFLVTVAVVLGNFNQQQLAEAERRVTSLRRVVAELEPYQKELARVRDETRRVEEALKAGARQGEAQAGVRPLSELARRMADAARRSGTVWLTRLAWSQGRVQVEGLATDAASVTTFLTQLTADGVLRQTQGSVSPEGAAGGVVRFSCELAVSAAGEAAPGAAPGSSTGSTPAGERR